MTMTPAAPKRRRGPGRGAVRRARGPRHGVRHDLLALLSSATSDFIGCPTATIDDAIRRTLAGIGTLFGVDRAYLFRFSADLATADNTHEWCAAGIAPQIDGLQGIPTAGLRWWMGELQARRPINLARLSQLPASAIQEREILESQAIRSLLVVPMVWGERLEGFAGFDHVRSSRTWTDEEVAVLEILVNSVSQAFERRRREETASRLARLAFHDPLTRLPNRALLAERLGSELERARADGTALGIGYLDLDGFKPINDVHGHDAGDRLLVEVARRMAAAVRPGDTVARLGGDEFVVLLPDIGDAQSAAERIRSLQRVIREPVAVATGLHVAVSASAGLRLVPPEDADAETMLRQADKAMYAAKQEGLAGVHVHEAPRLAPRADETRPAAEHAARAEASPGG
jgi:diguanylate cyclase (GGDEF)-like protein